ncbi:hypothetical protein [Desulfoscipio gibsoniae]|uniref:Uncharacterized protein n=1 Tax=Desulfoscipio gibsoniae DSM 7213 TaxID=767817 RepID=R4KNZ0_9FIRM|nr:hypothetical protein [Desulfoscipio gibsoniae]AGL02280.1 hypothetical protein Desgi_2881 [Desulfoscipio gibsoniae DSM 7213]
MRQSFSYIIYGEEFNPNNIDVEVAWPFNDEQEVTRLLLAVQTAVCMQEVLLL